MYGPIVSSSHHGIKLGLHSEQRNSDTIDSSAHHNQNRSENHGMHRLSHNSQKRKRWSALRVILSAVQIRLSSLCKHGLLSLALKFATPIVGIVLGHLASS
ncbi:hypothetical protein DPMN_093208 [Dreissena polymorpha]|uniref:Uncharacterized protein n=1 Tax=Dreissena polymorpha TaxID=45954 RepID=A0A9D4L3G3_DREPO|nr:hypothetical protein DPMN_093208 [Dreissena polymorpha]